MGLPLSHCLISPHLVPAGRGQQGQACPDQTHEVLCC